MPKKKTPVSHVDFEFNIFNNPRPKQPIIKATHHDLFRLSKFSTTDLEADSIMPNAEFIFQNIQILSILLRDLNCFDDVLKQVRMFEKTQAVKKDSNSVREKKEFKIQLKLSFDYNFIRELQIAEDKLKLSRLTEPFRELNLIKFELFVDKHDSWFKEVNLCDFNEDSFKGMGKWPDLDGLIFCLNRKGVYSIDRIGSPT